MCKNIKAVALISGGLDSLLAAKVIIDQGIHVQGINFYSGFFGVDTKIEENSAIWVARQLGIKLHVIDIFTEYKPVLLNPGYGYGANLNPCLDCKVFLVKKTKEWLDEHGFDFIISGEVVGQRPMSQRADTLPIVAKDSSADDLLLRPLSAKKLPLTKPEKEGWVDREKLYNFSGRSRKPQIELAKKLGFVSFPTPAGGCLLTETRFCARLKDLWATRKDYTKTDIELLKVGRHLRPRPNFKMIIGREHAENEILEQFKDKFVHMYCLDVPGPLTLIDGEVTKEDLKLAAQITARYSKARSNSSVEIEVMSFKQAAVVLKVTPLAVEMTSAYLL